MKKKLGKLLKGPILAVVLLTGIAGTARAANTFDFYFPDDNGTPADLSDDSIILKA